ncbi:CDP-alcohol phosphatidyltransferase family protein [Pseudonocardia cypriaca]|uniref:Cardiolipin synthase n=1 Tax=Pseudonocardia cypriaca TaxID=882449 RepID=A0A543GHD9_9PSEU|nr:CDP-alcohol phosphatidyltransferase family protein [Pseudonocardia cypriaca]TQM45476.1 cardiolipin synthase [Pseudonocardia cypriaca]
MAEPSLTSLLAQLRSDRVLTVPNLLSAVRLAGVPVFLYLLLVPGGAAWGADIWAIVVLALGGITDWLDGKLARLLGQYSALGALLDPAVDRLYILAALVALGVRDVVPWWAVIALVARDLLLAATLPVLRSRGYGPYQVTYLGKGATFLLLYAFPLLLAAQAQGWFADLARPFAYAFSVWGTTLYLYTGALYLAQFVRALRTPAHRAGVAGGQQSGG